MLEKEKDSVHGQKNNSSGNYLNLSPELYAQMQAFSPENVGTATVPPYEKGFSEEQGQILGQSPHGVPSGTNPPVPLTGQRVVLESVPSMEMSQGQKVSLGSHGEGVQSVEMSAAPPTPQVSSFALELFQLLKSQNLLPNGQNQEGVDLIQELDTLMKQEQSIQQGAPSHGLPVEPRVHQSPENTAHSSGGVNYPPNYAIEPVGYTPQGQHTTEVGSGYYTSPMVSQDISPLTMGQSQQEGSGNGWQVPPVMGDTSGYCGQNPMHNPLPPGAGSGLTQNYPERTVYPSGYVSYQEPSPPYPVTGRGGSVPVSASAGERLDREESRETTVESPVVPLDVPVALHSQGASGESVGFSGQNGSLLGKGSDFVSENHENQNPSISHMTGSSPTETVVELRENLEDCTGKEDEGTGKHDYISTPISPDQVHTFLKKDVPTVLETGTMQMEANADTLLKRILDIMLDSQAITQIALDCFFQGVVGVRIDHGNSVFYLATEDGGYMDSIRSNFSEKIEKTLEDLGFHRFTVEILDKNQLSMPQKTIITEDGMHAFASYTFDNYVVGESNQVAHSYANKIASQEIAMNENPFFLYGDSGCGKTHLSCAIGNRKKELFPNKKIKYCTGSEYMESWVSALSNNTTEEFKRTYRNVDMLIMDDIQFLASAESTLKELFDTFDNFLRLQKQIIFSSDRSPEELKNSGFHARLTTRFQQGLVRKVESPDYELRRAIIRQKAKVQGLVLETTVEELIATNFSNDVRNLEGAIKQIHAYKDFMYTEYSKQGSPNTKAEQEAQTAAVMNFVKDLVQSKEVIVTPERIVEEAAKHFNLKPEQLKDQGRKAHIVNARNVSIFLMHSIMGLTYKEIGSILGGRDHTTILNSLNKINKQRSDGATEILNAIEYIEHNINSPR